MYFCSGSDKTVEAMISPGLMASSARFQSKFVICLKHEHGGANDAVGFGGGFEVGEGRRRLRRRVRRPTLDAGGGGLGSFLGFQSSR